MYISQRMSNLRNLHIIRGLAALYVALGHAKVVFWVGGREYIDKFPRSEWGIIDYLLFALDLFSSSAQEFVIVFFVLSGFFIAYSFDKNNWSWKGFYANRALRIYPPYIASAIFAVAVIFFINYYNNYLFTAETPRLINRRLVASYHELDIIMGLKSILFIPQKDYIACNFAYWSLLYEGIFYLLIPLIIKRKNWAFIGMVISYAAGLFIAVEDNQFLMVFLFKYGFHFILGVCLYDFIKNNLDKMRLPNKWLCHLFLVGLTGSVIIFGILEKKPVSNTLAALLAAAAMIILLKYPVNKGRIFNALTTLGDISFSLYIFHLPFYFLCYAILSKVTGQYIFHSRIYWLFIPPVLVFAYVMYVLVEKKSLEAISSMKEKHAAGLFNSPKK